MNNGNKNIFFVEANVMNISAKFQLRPPYGLWEDAFFYYVFRKFSLSVAMETSQIQRFRQNSCLVEDYSKNISVIFFLSKYLQ